jgi:hypothetical protein
LTWKLARCFLQNPSWKRSANIPMTWLDVPYLPQNEPGSCLSAEVY